jgi:hypothetical protein
MGWMRWKVDAVEAGAGMPVLDTRDGKVALDKFLSFPPSHPRHSI